MYLEASAIAGNFTRAAKSLGINSATVSRRIGRLESELGLAVFERQHSGVRLTPGGRAMLPHVRRALAELDAIKQTGEQNGNGAVGEVRLAVRMPPVGEPLRDLLAGWRKRHLEVVLTIAEMNEWEIESAIRERRIDAALVTRHTLWSDAASAPLYREKLLAALPCGHPLSERQTLNWLCLRKEVLLVQGWDNSQAAREFYASIMGAGVRFRTHAASKQSIFALVSAGFGITLATKSQSEVAFPGVTYKPNVPRKLSITPVPPIALPAGGFRRSDRRGRGAWRRRIGEEAASALRPGGFASRVILRLCREDLTPLELLGERVGVRRWGDMQSLDARLTCPKMQRRSDDRDGDHGEAHGTADRRHVEETPAHQWNICAEPG
jgi:DNA-binding transcriptional LysR family regulator